MRHILFTLKGCPYGLLDDEAHIRNVLSNAATLSERTLLDISSHKFDRRGQGVIVLLGCGWAKLLQGARPAADHAPQCRAPASWYRTLLKFR